MSNECRGVGVRKFWQWLRVRFSIRTLGAVSCVFLFMVCIWVFGSILAIRFWIYVLGVPLPDFTIMLFPLGRLGAVLMALCFGAFSVYFVYARDTKWKKSDDLRIDEEKQ